MYIKKCPQKHPFLIFFDSFLNSCETNKNCDYSANFQNCGKFFFYMGTHYVDFTFAFDATQIWLEMTEIWPKYVAQAFLPPLWIVNSGPLGLMSSQNSIFYSFNNQMVKIWPIWIFRSFPNYFHPQSSKMAQIPFFPKSSSWSHIFQKYVLWVL